MKSGSGWIAWVQCTEASSTAREVGRVCYGNKGDEKVHGAHLTFLYLGGGSWSPSRSQISHVHRVCEREREQALHACKKTKSRRGEKEMENVEKSTGQIKKQSKSRRSFKQTSVNTEECVFACT